MTPSPEELSAGQKAYQNLRVYQHIKLSVLGKAAIGLILVTTIFIHVYSGQYWTAIWGTLVLAIFILGWRTLEANNRKNFELLRQLKTKYDPEIYDEIKKEPTSVRYYLFQKPYPLDRRGSPVELP